MARPRSARIELLAALVSSAVAFLSALQILHQPAKLVYIVTIFAGGFMAGVTVGRAVQRLRAGPAPAPAAAE